MDLTIAQNPNIFNIATEQARSIVYLHLFDLAICFLIAFTVIGLVTYVTIKFRDRGDEREPEQNKGNLKLEITWTVIPALILLTLGVLTAVVMHQVNPPVASRQPDVIINAHQWWWEYRYPKTGVVTANELYLPQGVNSLLQVRSADVAHSFWVTEFGQKMDAIPGHPNHVYYTPIKSGRFDGACSEFCGDDHSLMRLAVNVVPPEQFELWTKNQLKAPETTSGEEARRGESLFRTRTCVQCHTIAGTTATAQIGPDLTHVSQRLTLGSCILKNNRENLAAWIMNPQQFKPGCHMPKMRLTKEEAHDIAVYLEGLK